MKFTLDPVRIEIDSSVYVRLISARASSYDTITIAESAKQNALVEFAPAPIPKPWNGEGLPPVGTVCEFKRIPHGEWGEAIVRFSSSNVLVWDWADEPAMNGKCTAYAHEVECRVMRTPEQIEAEERTAAIRSMAEDMAAYKDAEEPNEKMLSLSTYLHDQGYRKQEDK